MLVGAKRPPTLQSWGKSSGRLVEWSKPGFSALERLDWTGRMPFDYDSSKTITNSDFVKISITEPICVTLPKTIPRHEQSGPCLLRATHPTRGSRKKSHAVC